MAKQTFTTGQVLTAAQVNALNSNDFNQTVSVKTAAYTLVAADKGTRIEFNTSGSVTCTVNTGLFDAGDTLIIQNRGAGAVTVTAGTATVNTSATLVLSQYDAGTLYFVSASAAIFFNTDAGGGSPLTTKGDLYTFSTVDARLGIGANNTVLTADSAEATGMKWAAASGGGLTLLQTLTLSGATTTSSTLSGSYKNLLIVVKGVYLAGNGTVYLRMNTDTGSNYSYAQARYQGSSVSLNTGFLTTLIELIDLGNNSTATQNGYGVINIYRYTDTDIINCDFNFNGYIAGNQRNSSGTAYYDNSAAITSVSFTTGSTFSAGTAYIYGVS
jgi:hypothetical protein